MTPPQALNVLDSHNGFTAITRSSTYVKIVRDTGVEREAIFPDDYPDGKLSANLTFVRWESAMRESGTLWRPAALLKRGSVGELQEYDECSFYQNNNNATKAIYKVKGYPYRIAVWFDNATGKRIA